MLTTGNDVWFMEKPSGGFHLPYMERNCVHRGRGVLRCPVSSVHAKWHKLKWPAFTQLNKILISDRNSISVGRIHWGGDWVKGEGVQVSRGWRDLVEGEGWGEGGELGWLVWGGGIHMLGWWVIWTRSEPWRKNADRWTCSQASVTIQHSGLVKTF